MAAPGNVSAATFSYNGGTNGNGTAIAPGGFATVLTLEPLGSTATLTALMASIATR